MHVTKRHVSAAGLACTLRIRSCSPAPPPSGPSTIYKYYVVHYFTDGLTVFRTLELPTVARGGAPDEPDPNLT